MDWKAVHATIIYFCPFQDSRKKFLLNTYFCTINNNFFFIQQQAYTIKTFPNVFKLFILGPDNTESSLVSPGSITNAILINLY